MCGEARWPRPSPGWGHVGASLVGARGVGVRGYVITFNRPVAKGVPDRSRGRRVRVWVPDRVRQDVAFLRLTGDTRYPWWCDRGGNVLTSSRPVAKGVPDRSRGRRVRVWVPDRVRQDVAFLRLTGDTRYPWWCDREVNVLTSSRAAPKGSPIGVGEDECGCGYRIGVWHDGRDMAGTPGGWGWLVCGGALPSPTGAHIPTPLREARVRLYPRCTLPHRGYRVSPVRRVSERPPWIPGVPGTTIRALSIGPHPRIECGAGSNPLPEGEGDLQRSPQGEGVMQGSPLGEGDL